MFSALKQFIERTVSSKSSTDFNNIGSMLLVDAVKFIIGFTNTKSVKTDN